MATNGGPPTESQPGSGDERSVSRTDSTLGFRNDAFERAIQGDGDADRTFETVLSTVEGWRDRNADATVRRVPHALKRTLDRELNADAESAWERDVVEIPSGQSTCDVVVNGAIGVEIVRGLNTNTTSEFRQRLRVLSQQYTHLLLFAYRLPREDIDQWRMLVKRLQPRDVDVERVGTVESFEYGEPESPDRTTTQRARMAATRGPEAVTVFIAVGLLGRVLQGLVAWFPSVGVEMRTFFVVMTMFYLSVLLFGMAYLRIAR